jgi:hypothetical protein
MEGGGRKEGEKLLRKGVGKRSEGVERRSTREGEEQRDRIREGGLEIGRIRVGE